jgi:hypothetical protein
MTHQREDGRTEEIAGGSDASKPRTSCKATTLARELELAPKRFLEIHNEAIVEISRSSELSPAEYWPDWSSDDSCLPVSDLTRRISPRSPRLIMGNHVDDFAIQKIRLVPTFPSTNTGSAVSCKESFSPHCWRADGCWGNHLDLRKL